MNLLLEKQPPLTEGFLFHLPTQQVCAVKKTNSLRGEVFESVETADHSRISALLTEFRPATDVEILAFQRAAEKIRPCLLDWA